MAIKDLNELDIINNIKINSNFISVDHEKLKIMQLRTYFFFIFHLQRNELTFKKLHHQ